MAAGVSAVRFDANAGQSSATAPQNIDTKFLSGSHFAISQDNSVTKGSLQSIFKRDYPPWPINGRPSATQPPAPAAVMHKDENRFNEKCSETIRAFEQKYLPKPLLESETKRISATNFKMDADVTKFDSFQTSHKLDYPPKAGGLYQKGGPSQNPMQSFIPQGDREKAPMPISDYRDRFRGHNTGMPEKVQPTNIGGGRTILGDNRLHHFATTHNDAYLGAIQGRVQPIVAPTGTSIPQGDREKEASLQTTTQVSYPKRDLATLPPYDRGATTGKLQRTNFKHGDGHGTWNNYQSEQSDAYRPISGNIGRSITTKERNHSDIPPGDDNPNREAYRVNMTNYRFYHGDPLPTIKPKIEAGANKRTKSNVWFGEPKLGECFYETTMETNYKPSQVPYTYNRSDCHSKSAVPMDYYANEKHNPTTWCDFQDPQQDRLIPNPVAIDNLKKSHIQPPLRGEREFSTEHLDQYTPKSTKLAVLDPGRLQRSSVPLGTMNA